MKGILKAIGAIMFTLVFPLLESYGQKKSILHEQKDLPTGNKGLVNTSQSSFTTLQSVNMDDVSWTSGFWADRFEVCRNAMVPHLWRVYHDASISHAFKNFEIAAGLDTGRHSGPPFHDGDFYKLLESVASLYAVTRDKELDVMMDKVIPIIAGAQREDGYLHTPVIIDQRRAMKEVREFQDRLNFETYNLGHLMTAACVHYRATGKRTLLDVAIKATDFLSRFYKSSTPQLARNAICPSHYMGVIEMYRTTGNPDYLNLARNLIDIRGQGSDGTDDNQDRIPFRKQTVAMGHAVRANYLYAGVADVYAETGDDSLLVNLNLIWDDVVNRKMYITGACGALYDGVSPYGTSYNPPEIQKTHQAYGRAYQLPNMTAHNETCANIGNVLWNWRMLQITGEAKYADVVELTLYNSVLSGISLDGKKFFYTNPLSASREFPYELRWSGGRKAYIGLSNCCPPNAVRTIAEVVHYLYSVSSEGLWFNLYGGNKLSTQLKDGSPLELTQETNYPWDGNIRVTLENAPAKPLSLFFRIPGWAKGARISVNGKSQQVAGQGKYIAVNQKWSKGDVIELDLPMEATLMEANPLVEETRNQVALKRGPIVYCLEGTDLAERKKIPDIIIPASSVFSPVPITINDTEMMGLKASVKCTDTSSFRTGLYRKIPASEPEKIEVTLIPYYAWGNRGPSDMTVWMPYGW